MNFRITRPHCIVKIGSNPIYLTPSLFVKGFILFVNIVSSRQAIKWRQALFGIAWEWWNIAETSKCYGLPQIYSSFVFFQRSVFKCFYKTVILLEILCIKKNKLVSSSLIVHYLKFVNIMVLFSFYVRECTDNKFKTNSASLVRNHLNKYFLGKMILVLKSRCTCFL